MPSPNWIHTLKRALGHYDEPYPGTPAYNHRRRLTESLSKIWRSHLHNLVLSDLQAGLHGRRKHFWEEMECIVAYELQPSTILGLLDEQRATGLLGLNTLDHLALHATYIFCPGFSGKNICSMVPTQVMVAQSRPEAVRARISPMPSLTSSHVSESTLYPPSLMSDSSSTFYSNDRESLTAPEPSPQVSFEDPVAKREDWRRAQIGRIAPVVFNAQ